MSLFFFLTVLQAIIGAALVGIILIQRSEGGGLGVGGGGSPSGLMSARGAANFLTRTTTVLATLFVGLSIALAALAVGTTSSREIDTTLDRSITPARDPLAPTGADTPVAPPAAAPGAAPAAPAGDDPLGNGAR